jgi:hypothetical protein
MVLLRSASMMGLPDVGVQSQDFLMRRRCALRAKNQYRKLAPIMTAAKPSHWV